MIKESLGPKIWRDTYGFDYANYVMGNIVAPILLTKLVVGILILLASSYVNNNIIFIIYNIYIIWIFNYIYVIYDKVRDGIMIWVPAG